MSEYIHKEYPKSVGRTEFWKQIKRTVNGQEVPDSDIETICDSVRAGLLFDKNDFLLDLGSGNSALGSRFYPYISRYLGVDFSEYLLEIANEHFFVDGKTEFQLLDLKAEYMNIFHLDKISKVLMYGMASYFTEEQLLMLLRELINKCDKLNKIYIGNLPEISCAEKFYSNRGERIQNLKDPNSVIGVWYDPMELKKALNKIGFHATLYRMPPDFYGSHYRFDMMLTKI